VLRGGGGEVPVTYYHWRLQRVPSPGRRDARKVPRRGRGGRGGVVRPRLEGQAAAAGMRDDPALTAKELGTSAEKTLQTAKTPLTSARGYIAAQRLRQGAQVPGARPDRRLRQNPNVVEARDAEMQVVPRISEGLRETSGGVERCSDKLRVVGRVSLFGLVFYRRCVWVGLTLASND
jgi:hypothetical protein